MPTSNPSKPAPADSLEQAPLSGTQLAGFRLCECISRSPSSAVYRAERGDEQAAVKLTDAVGPEPARDRGEREWRAHRKLRHRHIARLVDAGTHAGRRYMVTEWVDGESLEAALCRRRAPWRRAVDLVRQISAGLSAIHAAGIVHRDIKPSNIMIPTDPSAPLKIVDFGHSLILDTTRVTAQGTVLGTVDYMAPEQALGDDFDGRADFYSLGVIFYRALTGELPFCHRSPAEVLRCHQQEPVQDPRDRAPGADIPDSVADLCLWLLAKDPKVRVPTHRVLSVSLNVIRRGAQIAARSDLETPR